MMTTPTTQPAVAKRIAYDRATHDYAAYVSIDDGPEQYIGSAKSHHTAELMANAFIYGFYADAHAPEVAAQFIHEELAQEGRHEQAARDMGGVWVTGECWEETGAPDEATLRQWAKEDEAPEEELIPGMTPMRALPGAYQRCPQIGTALLASEQENIRVGDRVVLAQPNGYHLTGVVRALPGFIDMLSGKPTPYYSVDFACADGQTENLWPMRHDIRPEPSTTDRGLCFVCGRTEHTPETCPRAALHAITVTAFEPEPVGDGPDDGMTDDVNAYLDALDGVGPWPEAGAPSEARVNWSEGTATPLHPVQALKLALERGVFGLPETLAVLRASYEAATPTTECACCNTTQPCYDDGEAYICVDRAGCNARCQAPIEQAHIPPDFDPESRADQMDYVELPQLNDAYDAVKDGNDDAAIEQAAAALNAFYVRKRDYLQAQRA